MKKNWYLHEHRFSFIFNKVLEVSKSSNWWNIFPHTQIYAYCMYNVIIKPTAFSLESIQSFYGYFNNKTKLSTFGLNLGINEVSRKHKLRSINACTSFHDEGSCMCVSYSYIWCCLSFGMTKVFGS